MTKPTYQMVRDQVEGLPLEGKLRLLEELASMLQNEVGGPRRRIMDLEGLGADMWVGIDAQEFVDRERDSWRS